MELRRYSLNGIGSVSIPIILDTVEQDIAKRATLESNLEAISNMRKTKILKNYNIDLAQTFLKVFGKIHISFGQKNLWITYSTHSISI